MYRQFVEPFRTLAFLVLLLSLAASITARAAGSKDAPDPDKLSADLLTKNQRSQVNRGEIVVVENPKDYLGGRGFMIVDKPIWLVWQVVTDYPAYPKFMPRNEDTRVLQEKGQEIKLFSEYRSHWPLSNVWNKSRLTHNISNPNRLSVTWQAYETNLKFNFGSWVLVPIEPNTATAISTEKTLVMYSNNFDIGWVPRALARSASRDAMAETLASVRKRMENPTYQDRKNISILSWDYRISR